MKVSPTICSVATALLWTAGAACAAAFQIEDVHRIADVAGPVVTPDGRWIAYTVSSADKESNKTVTHVWLASGDGKQRTELTVSQSGSKVSPASAWLPQFSGDGSALAFISDQAEDHTAQVWIRALDQTGQQQGAHQVTHFEGGVSDFSLAPDGQQIAVVAEVANGEKDDGPIVIDRFQFKDDERGYLTKKRRRLFRVGVSDQSEQALTDAGLDVWLPAWSPDGRSIAWVGKRQHEGDRHAGFNVYLINAQDGKGLHCVSKDGLVNNDPDHASRPAWSPDSRQLAYLQGGPEKLLEYAPWELAVVNLADDKIRQVGKADRNFVHPQFSADGKALYAIVEESRTAYLTRIDLRSGAAQNLTAGRRMDADFSVDQNNRAVTLVCDDLHPCRLSVIDHAGETVLADHNAWLSDYTLAVSEDLQIKSRDGTLVDALLIKPLGYQSGQRYPTIIRVHGGPIYQFSHEFMIDWQLFAAHGYAVLAVNPRGSSGRGFRYAHAIWADWGNRDVQDVLAATDYLVTSGIADKKHLGIGGWSYGGMLTDYVIASDQRFQAAIAGAGAANIFTNYGVDEYTVSLETELGTPWNNPGAYKKVSFPFFHNERIVTPTLFLCGSLDFNVPCAGSEQMYQALSSRRIPTELVIYRDQHHQLDVPGNIVDRFSRYLNWYDRFLKNASQSAPAGSD